MEVFQFYQGCQNLSASCFQVNMYEFIIIYYEF